MYSRNLGNNVLDGISHNLEDYEVRLLAALIERHSLEVQNVSPFTNTITMSKMMHNKHHIVVHINFDCFEASISEIKTKKPKLFPDLRHAKTVLGYCDLEEAEAKLISMLEGAEDLETADEH